MLNLKSQKGFRTRNSWMMESKQAKLHLFSKNTERVSWKTVRLCSTKVTLMNLKSATKTSSDTKNSQKKISLLLNRNTASNWKSSRAQMKQITTTTRQTPACPISNSSIPMVKTGESWQPFWVVLPLFTFWFMLKIEKLL